MVALPTHGGQPCGNIRRPSGLKCVVRGQAVKDLMPFNHIGKRDDGQVKLYGREGKEASGSGGGEAVTTAGASGTEQRTAAVDGRATVRPGLRVAEAGLDLPGGSTIINTTASRMLRSHNNHWTKVLPASPPSTHNA